MTSGSNTPRNPSKPLPAGLDETAAEVEAGKWPTVRKLGLYALVLAVGVYLAWWVALYVIQDQLMFPGTELPAPQRTPHFPDTLVITQEVPGGGKNEAWIIPGIGVEASNPGPLVIYFHGNAELIDWQDHVVEPYWRRGISVMLPEYRGYGRSGGKPGKQGILEDMLTFYEFAAQLPQVDKTKIVYHGRSLGAAVAADLASYRQPAALILESAFTSATAMAGELAAPAFIVKNRYETDRILPSLDIPVLLLHGRHDEIVNIRHGRLLAGVTPQGKLVELDAGHNDLMGPMTVDGYWRSIMELLTAVGISTKELPVPKPEAKAVPDAKPDTGAEDAKADEPVTTPSTPQS